MVETPRVAGTRLISAASGVDNVYAGALGGPVNTPGGGWRESLTTNGNARGLGHQAPHDAVIANFDVARVILSS